MEICHGNGTSSTSNMLTYWTCRLSRAMFDYRPNGYILEVVSLHWSDTFQVWTLNDAHGQVIRVALWWYLLATNKSFLYSYHVISIAYWAKALPTDTMIPTMSTLGLCLHLGCILTIFWVYCSSSIVAASFKLASPSSFVSTMICWWYPWHVLLLLSMVRPLCLSVFLVKPTFLLVRSWTFDNLIHFKSCLPSGSVPWDSFLSAKPAAARDSYSKMRRPLPWFYWHD